MSGRAEMLATKLDREMFGMADFVSGLDESQLSAACGDPMGATVAHVLRHLREGTDQVLGWAATVSGGQAAAGAGGPGSGHDHAGHDHAGHDHAGHDHAGHDHAGHDHAGHDHAGVGDAAETAAALRAGATTLGAVIRGLSDEQLDHVPPPSPGLADGATPLHAIIAFIAADVAGHRAHLDRAVAAQRVSQDVR